jgi:CRP-like cAMP-binding protein
VFADTSVFALLRRHPLFVGMDDASVDQVLWSSRIETVAAGDRIYERGQEARHFFVVVEGRVNLSLCARSGVAKVVEILRRGQVCGEAGMFREDRGYPVTAIAATTVRVAKIANRDYLAVLRQCPDTCLRMISHLMQRLDRHIHQIETLTLESATHRLARILVSRLPADGQAQIELGETRQELASFLSMQPETLSRALRSLVEYGVIAVQGKAVRVLDRAALYREAETESA